jgi:hypothetical protein
MQIHRLGRQHMVGEKNTTLIIWVTQAKDGGEIKALSAANVTGKLLAQYWAAF